jgi:hypothetical protein
VDSHPITTYRGGGEGPGHVIAFGALFVAASVIAIMLGVGRPAHPANAPVVLKVTASCGAAARGSGGTGAAGVCPRPNPRPSS